MSYADMIRSAQGGGEQGLSPEVLRALMEQQSSAGGGPGFFAQGLDAGLGVAGKALDFISHPGQAVRSLASAPGELLQGDVGGALGRVVDAAQHGVEFGADLFTGGVASEAYRNLTGEDFTTRAESPEFTDVLSAYGAPKLKGWKGFAADVIGGALTDPLTYVTGAGGAGASLARGGAVGGSRAAAKSLMTRGLMQTAKGRTALLTQVGQETGDAVAGALRSGSLKGLMENSLKMLDDASEKILAGRMTGPVRMGDDLFMNTANEGLIQSAIGSLGSEGLLRTGGLQFGLPGMAKASIPGSEALTGMLPSGLKHGAAPAVAGELLGGGLGLPAGVGGALGVGVNAGVRKFAPKAAEAFDGAVSRAWGDTVKGVYSKFERSGLPKGVEQTARQFWNRKQGADRESLEAAKVVFDGVTPEQSTQILGAMREVESGINAATPASMAAGHMAAAGVSDEGVRGALEKIHGLDKVSRDKALAALSSAEVALPGREVDDAAFMLRGLLGDDSLSARPIAKAWFGVPVADRSKLLQRAHEAGDVKSQRMAAVYLAAQKSGLPADKAMQVLGHAFKAFDTQQDELVKLGVFQRGERSFYVPHVMNRELQQRFRDAGVDAHETFKRGWFKDSHTKARKNATLEDFEAAVKSKARQEGVSLKGIDEIAVRNIADLVHSRQLAHNETMFRTGLKQHMQEFAGATKALDADTAVDQYVRNLTAGMPARGRAQKALAWANKYTKPYQTVYVPAFHARNMVSTWAQVLLDPSMTVKDSVKIAAAQVADMPLLRVLSKPFREQGDVYKFLEAANNPGNKAAQKSVSSIKIGRYTGDEVLKFAKQGVLQNNFGEEILEQLGVNLRGVMDEGPKGMLAKTKDKIDRTATSASAYIEDRARLTAFVGLLEKGTPAPEAITRVKRIFVDYDVQSGMDRMLRDVVPYARFMTGNTPVVVSEVSRRPGLLSAQARAAEHVQRNDPLAPKDARLGMAIPLGDGDYFAGLGLPQQAAFDALEAIPGVGQPEGLRRMLGSTNPMLSFPLQKATNRNLYFGGDFDRPSSAPDWLPAVGPVRETSYGGKEFSPLASQLMNTGPAARFAGSARSLDDGFAAIITKFVTGMGVKSTDEERELSSAVKGWLDGALRRGEVGKVVNFYQRGTSPEAEEAVRINKLFRKHQRETRKKAAK